MKNTTLVILAAFLCSCSLMERHEDSSAESIESHEQKSPPIEAEVSRLNTKIAALETKLDVLSSNFERMEMKKSQPIINAEAAEPQQEPVRPQPNMAAPVELTDVDATTSQVSAAPVRPLELPATAKSTAPKISNEVEKEFRASMTLFQNGKNAEAATKFSNIAKKYPQHLLASHALYWSGEASARAQQWSNAIESWSELERSYPRSAYLPEALSGLSKAFDTQGDSVKSRAYKENLHRAFPKSPVAMNHSNIPDPIIKKSTRAPEEDIPEYQEKSIQDTQESGIEE